MKTFECFFVFPIMMFSCFAFFFIFFFNLETNFVTWFDSVLLKMA